jgi:hypothetical protein
VSKYRCDLQPFLLDTLDFIIDQIELARSGTTNLDYGDTVLDVAYGVVPQFRQRLLENNRFGWVVANSSFDEWVIDPGRQEKWKRLAKEPSEQFNKSADDLVATIKKLKQAIEKLDRDGHLPSTE